ncbi:MAG: hypothetical protein CL944_02785 [Candidatus Diapherotrites archaeon]|uniref:Uncharacterized protein n=1 Tax=Candidatus Iainarchaeum sp. TaxID=3101447 RepID=A0A2D6LQ96_9ARCH|nr:hypothetical protein [Candidatus Diapherotrites archaeon]|tara:strand:+ start:587 stop:859 length:273 start_codon:yes stop_codon:yes gene_type:complete
MKGVIFSTDAILAMVVIIALFSGLAVSNIASTGEVQQSLLSAKATDNSLIAFYTDGTATIEEGLIVNCKELFEHDEADTLNSKVKECRAT